MTIIFATIVGGFSLGQAAPNFPAFNMGRIAGARIYKLIDRVPAINVKADGTVPKQSLKVRYNTITCRSCDGARKWWAAIGEPPGHLDLVRSVCGTVQDHLLPAQRVCSLQSCQCRANFTAAPPCVQGDIKLRGVSFAYPARSDVPVFEDLDLDIVAGQTVALVGQSGSGKSTIIQLLERFYDPLSGTIEVDGHNIRSLSLSWYRDQVGLVSQEPTLFATSIRENIALGRAGATEKEIQEAAKSANAHNFIAKLPKGYNTQVGEAGVQLRCAHAASLLCVGPEVPLGLELSLGLEVLLAFAVIERHSLCALVVIDARSIVARSSSRLSGASASQMQCSGGQKQRVAIARALLKNPGILLLDEATSALDTVSERLVQDALENLAEGRTTIVVAHRLSTIRSADTIAVVQVRPSLLPV